MEESKPVDETRWHAERVYFRGDTVVDDVELAGSDYPTPPGRFRALVDHYSGILGPRFLEVDVPGVWERTETFETPDDLGVGADADVS